MKIGDTIKDIVTYLKFRIQHLTLEMQKVPFTVNENKREQAYKKLQAKIYELRKTLCVINGNVKEKSKYEWSKVQYLKKKKIEILKEIKTTEQCNEGVA